MENMLATPRRSHRRRGGLLPVEGQQLKFLSLSSTFKTECLLADGLFNTTLDYDLTGGRFMKVLPDKKNKAIIGIGNTSTLGLWERHQPPSGP